MMLIVVPVKLTIHENGCRNFIYCAVRVPELLCGDVWGLSRNKRSIIYRLPVIVIRPSHSFNFHFVFSI